MENPHPAYSKPSGGDKGSLETGTDQQFSAFFLRLPRELRRQIYELVAVSTGHKYVRIFQATSGTAAISGGPDTGISHRCTGSKDVKYTYNRQDTWTPYMPDYWKSLYPVNGGDSGAGDLFRLGLTCRRA